MSLPTLTRLAIELLCQLVVTEKYYTNKCRKGGVPELWNGNAVERIVNNIYEIYE